LCCASFAGNWQEGASPQAQAAAVPPPRPSPQDGEGACPPRTREGSLYSRAVTADR
jgi:hypothetical protein